MIFNQLFIKVKLVDSGSCLGSPEWVVGGPVADGAAVVRGEHDHRVVVQLQLLIGQGDQFNMAVFSGTL